MTGIAIVLASLLTSTNGLSLDAIQGAWWSSCADPAAAFYVDGNTYGGDFEGTYEIELTDDVLVFHEGLVDGHSVHVTRKPLSFRVLDATDNELVLRPLPGNPRVDDWRLVSCDGGV